MNIRKDLKKEMGIEACIEVCDRVDTNISLNDEELYQIYKDMRKRDIICSDFKHDNIGKLIKNNIPRNNKENGMMGIVDKTLEAGEYVLIDTDFIYKEGDKDIIFSSDLSLNYERRYKQELEHANNKKKA